MAPPGLYRMPLPLPLVGLPAVNVYVLEGPDGLILIDAGWASQEAYDRLGQGGLAELGGHRLGDIDTFVITHAHWDHYSLASRVRQDHPQVGWWSVAASGRRSRDTPPRSGSTAARVRNCAGTARPRSPTAWTPRIARPMSGTCPSMRRAAIWPRGTASRWPTAACRSRRPRGGTPRAI